jgi:hypothetical protein
MNLGAVYTIPGKNDSEARRKKKEQKGLCPPIVYPHPSATSFKRKPRNTVDKVERRMKKKKREKRKRKGTIK